MRTVQASELGSFVYCRRAWWYRLRGIRPDNLAGLSRGRSYHTRHGSGVLASRLLFFLAVVILAGALFWLALLLLYHP